VETSCTIYGLDETKTYYFVARAFDTEAFESSNSNEVYFEAAVTPDNQPPVAVIAEDYIVLSQAQKSHWMGQTQQMLMMVLPHIFGPRLMGPL
jgi:hypothetical protein